MLNVPVCRHSVFRSVYSNCVVPQYCIEATKNDVCTHSTPTIPHMDSRARRFLSQHTECHHEKTTIENSFEVIRRHCQRLCRWHIHRLPVVPWLLCWPLLHTRAHCMRIAIYSPVQIKMQMALTYCRRRRCRRCRRRT